MAIVSSYFSGEAYGLLGPQIAATLITENTPYDCVVVAVAREDDPQDLKSALDDYFGAQRPVVGFSTLSGRPDLLALALELKAGGALTLLAGPQADADFLGESDCRIHPHRFKGLSRHFAFALQGPAEQSFPLLKNQGLFRDRQAPGLIWLNDEKRIIQNPPRKWEERFLKKVDWHNLYRLKAKRLSPHDIAAAQVLQQIGCPFARKGRWVEIDLPAYLAGDNFSKIRQFVKGCSFCDVAVDKGFYGRLSQAAVIRQLQCLPADEDGRKIPFELINENPLADLSALLKAAESHGIRLSQINLTMRADWLVRGEKYLRDALERAREMGVFILLSSVGFESFDDHILQNLNKGVRTKDNLAAVFLSRRLKQAFPGVWGYQRGEGANHGFIHPTPWDTPETTARMWGLINRYSLSEDILPGHSTPLIVHHASALGDWIRTVESRLDIRFRRYGSVIGWWEEALI